MPFKGPILPPFLHRPRALCYDNKQEPFLGERAKGRKGEAGARPAGHVRALRVHGSGVCGRLADVKQPCKRLAIAGDGGSAGAILWGTRRRWLAAGSQPHWLGAVGQAPSRLSLSALLFEGVHQLDILCKGDRPAGSRRQMQPSNVLTVITCRGTK